MTGRVWAEPLLHPVCLLSMAVWWLNDHVGKVYVPSEFTGKASDVAGLAVFPLWTWCLLDGLGGLMLPRVYRSNFRLRLWCLYTVAALICAAFAAINVSESVGAAHRTFWTFIYGMTSSAAAQLGGYWPPNAHHTVDAADLWTLPASLIGVWVGRRWLTTSQDATLGASQGT